MARGPLGLECGAAYPSEMARSVSMSNSQRNEHLPTLDVLAGRVPAIHVVTPKPRSRTRASGTTRMAGTQAWP